MQNFSCLGWLKLLNYTFPGGRLAGRPNLKLMLTSAQLGQLGLGLSLAKIFDGTISEQKEILQRFRENLKTRTMLKENTTNHVILSCDPLPPCDNRGVAME